MKTTRRTPTGVRSEPRELRPLSPVTDRWPRLERASFTCYICARTFTYQPCWRHVGASGQRCCASHAVYGVVA